MSYAALQKILDFWAVRPKIRLAAAHKAPNQINQSHTDRTPKESQMYVTPEQIQATTKANVEAILSLATSQFAAIEKFATLNANAVKAAFEDSIANTRALAGAKDVQEFVNLQSTFAQPTIENGGHDGGGCYALRALRASTPASNLPELARQRVMLDTSASITLPTATLPLTALARNAAQPRS